MAFSLQILVALLILSNVVIALAVFRIARLKRKIEKQRVKIRELRGEAEVRFAGQLPSLHPGALELAKSSTISRLAERASQGRRIQLRIPDLLPEPGDLPDIHQIVPMHTLPDWGADAGRKNMKWQSDTLRYLFREKPELAYVNALAISYLRRRTAHTDKARAVFHRIWRDHGDDLISHLNIRWKLSTLLTFYDHPLSPEQKLIGATGWVYGSLLNIHEIERRYEGRTRNGDYLEREVFRRMNGDRPEFGDQDLYININTKIAEVALTDRDAGRVLASLLEDYRQTRNVFTRYDDARRSFNVNMSDESVDRNWCFGDPPGGE